MQGRVLILAGGGGHTGYAYALAQALYGKVSLSFLVPEGDTLSERRLSRFGKVDFLIKPRGPKTPTPIFAAGLAKAFLGSIKQPFHKFDVVVSTGGNFCVFPTIMAWMRGVPVVNIESSVRFLKPSKTARILQPFSTITALWWKEQKKLLKGVVVGPLLPKPMVKPRNRGYILVTGGTYGHKLLFDALAETNLHNVVLQTGKVDPTPYMEKHPEWKVITATERFHELLAGAGLVVTHFGFTVFEALVYKKHIVIVVNPEWTRTVGAEDAERLARKINAVLVSEMKTETLLDAINEARERKVPILPKGAENLANMIIKLSQGR
ncbi:MAG: undecaprenyldiphospho-muramoylpentapeptide beta-N- acetylglucosaminyltransferase [Candidatus Bathyarchaeota archaeon BA2]|nr:MAG: undecaprenyldiphospho-muramoylpentapeptide beta-N- acetylglucosaminyltransferase [Candidatus Bathyarchaeota archaeon BA2]